MNFILPVSKVLALILTGKLEAAQVQNQQEEEAYRPSYMRMIKVWDFKFQTDRGLKKFSIF